MSIMLRRTLKMEFEKKGMWEKGVMQGYDCMNIRAKNVLVCGQFSQSR